MDTPGYVILSRLGAQLRATQVLAHNLANAETPAFQAERPIFAQYLEPQRDAGAAGVPTAFTVDRATWRDTTPGALTTTGNPLDVAIRGEGYFVVETQQGERYTRAGRFTLGPDGRLTDMEGNAVLDMRGTPLTFGPNDTRI
ncbi:MAG: flagellar hook basal-body protein, partial [Acetobacteraceae bacterium]|nr:flagellar hook basal-body protein [Acetobacteraceae bacterium]